MTNHEINTFSVETANTIGNVCVSRHPYNDYIQAFVPFEQIDGFKWDYCGADNSSHNSPRIYGYIPYELACETGILRHPMRNNTLYDVKVCVIAKYTDKKAMKEIKDIIGERPKSIKL